MGGSGRWILSIPQSGGWYKVMGPGARMGGQRPWRALERLPASAFTEGVPRTRGRETMCSPLPRGAHEAAGTQAGRQADSCHALHGKLRGRGDREREEAN